MAGEQSRVTTIVSLVTHVDLLPPSRATPRRRIVQGKPAWVSSRERAAGARPVGSAGSGDEFRILDPGKLLFCQRDRHCCVWHPADWVGEILPNALPLFVREPNYSAFKADRQQQFPSCEQVPIGRRTPPNAAKLR